MTFTTKISLTDDKKARDIFFILVENHINFCPTKISAENFSSYCFNKLLIFIQETFFISRYN